MSKAIPVSTPLLLARSCMYMRPGTTQLVSSTTLS